MDFWVFLYYLLFFSSGKIFFRKKFWRGVNNPPQISSKKIFQGGVIKRQKVVYFFLFRFCSWHHSWPGHKKIWCWTAPGRHIYSGVNIWNYRKITNIREFSEFLVFVTLLFRSEPRASNPYSISGHKMKPRNVIQKFFFIFHIRWLDPKILLGGSIL